MVPSSSGLGRLVLIQKIVGSTPAGTTKPIRNPEGIVFLLLCNKKRNEVSRIGLERRQAIQLAKRAVRAPAYQMEYVLWKDDMR